MFAWVPWFNEEVYRTFPGGRFLVADMCAGLRNLLASLALVAMLVVLNLRSERCRPLLLMYAFALIWSEP